MSTTRVVFDEVSTRSRWAFRCPACHKRLVRIKKFYQTLNPFNLNRRGEPKTSAEILAELRIEVNSWQASDVYCQEHTK